MGAWSASITGNDTAADLRGEYQVAFFYYNDVETALRKIDDYVRKEGFDESDENEWCDYYYSLANFMWSKGILTDAVRNEALRLIDSGFGLEIWQESGAKALNERKKALEAFRKKITCPQPAKKKITVNRYMIPIFNTGDIIAFQLQTLDKQYANDNIKISEEDFKALNGKYIAVRKIRDMVSWKSSIEPAVRDIWPEFQLYDNIFDEVPALEDVIKSGFAKMRNRSDGLFYCEGSMFYFKRRKYVVLGNYLEGIEGLKGANFGDGINFTINHWKCNADSDLIDAISSRETIL
ncbi:MAG: hypothetical protein FWE85_01690 [Clostridiales bacterium]|nr:hypothetical protein [Clostridiales bacterium]